MFSLQRFVSDWGPYRKVVVLAWPILVSMLSYTVMGIVDTMLVGGLGTVAIAASGLANSVSFVALSFGNGVLHGVKVVAAQKTGAGDDAAARKLAWQGLWLALIIGLPIAMLAPLAPSLVVWLGAPPSVAGPAGAALAIRVAGAPIAFAFSALAAFLQGRSRTGLTMIATLVSNAVMIGLDASLLYGLGPFPAVGVAGAAIAMVIAWAAGTVVLVVGAWPVLRSTPPRPDPELLSAIWRLGSPMGLQMMLDVASFALMTTLLVRVGEAALAAHLIAIRILSVSFMPGYAIGEGASVLVGQAVGARRPKEAYAAWRAATGLAVVLMVGWGFVFVAIPDVLIAGFRPEPAVAVITHHLLMIGAAFQVFDAVTTVAYGALAGAGDTRFTMVSNVLVCWGLKLPLVALFAITFGLGAEGAWIGLTVEIVALALLALWRIRGGKWLGEVREDPQPVPALAA
jgi:MATE family multidrug resistance protein